MRRNTVLASAIALSYGVPVQATTISVPEPGILSLTGIGLVAVVLVIRLLRK